MSNFSDSFWRRAGKNTADRVSNAIFGDNWARPYKRITDEAKAEAMKQRAEAEAMKQQAEAIANFHYTRAEIAEKEQLNAIDAAVLKNVDKVISMPFSEDTNELSNQLNELAIQLSTNSFSKGTAEDKIRAKYTEAVFQKIEQGLNILLAKDPYNVNVEYIYKAYLKGKKERRKSLRRTVVLGIIWVIILQSFLLGILLAMDGYGALLGMTIIAAIITLCIDSIWINVVIKLRNARKEFDLKQAKYNTTGQTEQYTAKSTNNNVTSHFNQKQAFDYLWNKYRNSLPLLNEGYCICQISGQKDILIIALHSIMHSRNSGSAIVSLQQHDSFLSSEYMLVNSSVNLLDRATRLDLFPIQGLTCTQVVSDVVCNPKMFDYVVEQISLNQTIIEDVVRPRLIIVCDSDSQAFLGKLPEFVWMGYSFKHLEKKHNGDLYQIIGFRSEGRIQPNRARTNLIGTKVFFVHTDIPSAYDINAWLKN
ncbi:MAG: hypothetical protein J6V30_04550 [Paludibacteraceae bacterium]|nr:hypothetical protein [Paludibacteraceae bacterium]